MQEWERVAVEVFGGIPRGKLFGMQVFEAPDMPDDRIRIVFPNGSFSEFPFP